MFTYYLCNDNETIYKIRFSIKEEEKEYYLSLLENYLTELVFCEESELKKLVEEDKIEKENKDKFSLENGLIFLKRTMVTSTEKIEDYLPSVVAVKTKKYFFLRSCTIFILINLLSQDLDKIDNSAINKIVKLLGYSNFIDFKLISEIFLDELGNISCERFYDYNSLMSLLPNLNVRISEKYSRSTLLNFWQGDEAEREIADGIVSDSDANKVALRVLNFDPLKSSTNTQIINI